MGSRPLTRYDRRVTVCFVMLLQITHTTTYRYDPAIRSAQHMAYLLPRHTTSQEVLDSTLHIDPSPATRRDAIDVYGNHCTFFSYQRAHDALCIHAQSKVRTQAPTVHLVPTETPPWERVRSHFEYRAGAVWDAAIEFSFASPHVQIHADFAHYARASFAPHRPVLEAAIELMQRMHRDFQYASQSTDIHTPARDALSQRRGVCQDFAHILLSCLRTQGLAARYVSGYLLTEPPQGQPRLVGSDASHAWVSLYVPSEHAPGQFTSGQWVDLDPTNDRWGVSSPGEDYVCLAWGRDFSDVSPVRGVIHGGTNQTLEVGVTVLPLDQPIAPVG